ncbi:unnamed protein product [Nippostrongylus brasiliensis]|uniref:Uncharacterized protein n=1 Tax=Nippostrongylus brasiliensis TaxID=27835 RepID=A0A0N4XSB9_NIPBR|nr:unnamed protein product [Nippostrongylus brasiliensis]
MHFQESQPSRSLSFLEPQVPQVALDHKDLQDHPEATESTELQESLDQRDPTESQEHLDRTESPANLDILVKTASPERRVSAPSTALSMEESSSRTELAVRCLLCITALFIKTYKANPIKRFTTSGIASLRRNIVASFGCRRSEAEIVFGVKPYALTRIGGPK